MPEKKLRHIPFDDLKKRPSKFDEAIIYIDDNEEQMNRPKKDPKTKPPSKKPRSKH